jgi:hypothetical protein
MTVFSLLTYSCVTLLGFGGELISKTCRWDAGSFYQAESRCSEKGQSLIGNKVHSFMAEDRKIENFKCSPQHVE